MMHPTFGTQASGVLPPSYPYDAFIDRVASSAQSTFSQVARRLSRSSTGQRAAPSMRVSKPPSTSNSPRSSMIMARRRTMVNDSQTVRRHQQAMEYLSVNQGIQTTPNERPTRPVSWHPTTHVQPQLQYLQQQPSYPFTMPAMYADQQEMIAMHPQYSPMLAAYSNNTSPSSAFSPLPVSYPGVHTVGHLNSNGWDIMDRAASCYPPLTERHYSSESCPPLEHVIDDKAASSNTLDWNNFIIHGFNTTSPPTPDSFVQVQQAQPVVSEASIPYQPLEEPEEEGEILVGMGLYDTPDKYEEDPHLNNYRSTVSSLLGSAYLPQEPKGKGLKLEETWEPPKSDDSEEDQDEEDDDESTED